MHKLILVRRISQTFFFCLFVYLVLTTEYRFGPEERAVPAVLKLFFDLNPLNLAGVSLAAGVLYGSLVFAFVVLLPTFFFGRFFCGWICPLGSLNQFSSCWKLKRGIKAATKLMRQNVHRPYQNIKYYVLIAFAGMAILGSLQTGLLDPVSLLARSVGLVILPAITLLLKSIFDSLWASPIQIVSLLGEGLYRTSSYLFLPGKQPLYSGTFWLALIFIVVIVGNRIFTRFWCRALCPLGALLGLAARFSIFGLKKDESACDGCNKCLLYCQGADNPHRELPHRRSECHMCLNCLGSCPKDALSFGFYVDAKTVTKAPDLSRRRAVMAGLMGVLAIPVLRSGIEGRFTTRPRLIRPPGALAEEEFLARCIRCGQCMKICPTNALHPALLDGGWEAIFTPVLVPAIGYCEYDCILCGRSCPSGAIKPLTLKEKHGSADAPAVRIGTAFIDRGRCLPWAYGKECIVCEEWCPTSPKAIKLEAAEGGNDDYASPGLRRPYVIAEICIGCGACEYACPVQGAKAIYVHAVGESRNPENEMLLRRRPKII